MLHSSSVNDRAPSGAAHIVLEVCKNEGLQQIIWISRLLPETEERDKPKLKSRS
jgi:hypothetical protein